LWITQRFIHRKCYPQLIDEFIGGFIQILYSANLFSTIITESAVFVMMRHAFFPGKPMKLAIIVATDEQGLIGRDNDLPWRLSADLQYFRKVTMGKPIIMGRQTHESIGRALPGRKNIVLTSDSQYQAEGCTVVHSLDAALAACDDAEEAMVMGGASLYQQFLDKADRLYLTLVHATLEGDTWFPEWDAKQWQLEQQSDHQADDSNEFDYSFLVYQRVAG
jgi:dihydrofolate reductase